MNKVTAIVDIEAERAWLNQEKAQLDRETGKPVTWEKLGKSIGIKHQTLSLFGGKNYNAPGDKIAVAIRAYREAQVRRTEINKGMLAEPGYIEMPTATRINSLLEFALTGQITLACTGPGTSKTYIAKRFKDEAPKNVWMVTMQPAKKRLTPMVSAVLTALGGTPRMSTSWNSDQVFHLLQQAKGCLIMDEGNNLDFESMEQLRAWHDVTGVGICLLGNQDLIKTIESGPHAQALGRLKSRIDRYLVQDLPLIEDVDAYLDGWGIKDEAMRRLLVTAGMHRGSGGLREIKKIIQSASMSASVLGEQMSAKFLRRAQEERSTRILRAVA